MPNYYYHRDDLLISEVDSFGLLQGLHNATILSLGKIFTGQAGFVNDAFLATAEINKEPGGQVRRTLLVKIGPVMFPGGEVYNGRGFSIRIPLTRNSGIDYLVVRHVDLRYDPAVYSGRFKTQPDYRFRMDGVKLLLQSDVPSLSIAGTDLIAASIRYTPSEVTVTDLRDPYHNFWSSSESLDPSMDIPTTPAPYQAMQRSLRSPSIESRPINIASPPCHDESLARIAVILPAQDDPRCNWELLCQSLYTSSAVIQRGASLLPIVEMFLEGDNRHIVGLNTLQGMHYNIYARARDCYRTDLETEYNDGWLDIIGGGGEQGCPFLTPDLDSMWFSAFPLVKAWTYFAGDMDAESWNQLWIADHAVDVTKLPDHEGYFGTFTPVSPAIPGKITFPGFYSTSLSYRNRIVGPDGRVVGDKTGSITKSGNGYACPSNELMIVNFSPDPFKEAGVGETYSTDRMFWHGREVGRVANYGEFPLYLFKAEFTNNGPVEAADSDEGIMQIVGNSSFSMDVDVPSGAIPFTSSWEATAQDQEIELNVGDDMIFRFYTLPGGNTYCRVQGNLKLYFRKHTQVW